MKEFMIGARGVGSAVGKTDKAFIGTYHNLKYQIAIFENGMDFIGYPTSLRDLLIQYNKLVGDKGWTPMDGNDMRITFDINLPIFDPTVHCDETDNKNDTDDDDTDDNDDITT